MKFLMDHMAALILGSLGVTYLIAVILVSRQPSRWRPVVWITQVAGFGATCFVMTRIGLEKPLGDSLGFALAGAGVGALAAWRWDGIAMTIRDLARAARRTPRR